MIIRDMNERKKRREEKDWDTIPQSANSSRNKVSGAMSALSHLKVKNTIVPNISAIRLENSQEIPSSFSTLDNANLRKRRRGMDSAHKSESESLSKNTSKAKGDKRGSIKQLKNQKYFKDRIKDASNIYTNSSVNISNFLNWSMHPRMLKSKKKRSEKAPKNAYSSVSRKNNYRSQSR